MNGYCLTVSCQTLQKNVEDMFNVDETALFFQYLPDCTFILKGETYSGDKKSSDG